MTRPELDSLAVALRELSASATHPPTTVPDGQRACPVCGLDMETLKHFDVVMDVCEEHGVWLDQGELALILERAYWHRRELDSRPELDRMRIADETRANFKASLNRIASMIGR